MAGILDLFDSPDLLQNLFGISSAQAKPAPGPTPLPPFQGSAEPPLQGGGFGGQPVQTTSLGPSGYDGSATATPSMKGDRLYPPAGISTAASATPQFGQVAIDPGSQFSPGQQPPMGAPIDPSRNQDGGPNMPFASRAQPIQDDLASAISDPQGYGSGAFNPSANLPQPPNMAPVVPRPAPQGGPGGPVQMADASGRVPIPMQPAPPPPPSVMAQPGGPPMTGTAGGLSASLGLNPNAMQIGLASLGKGLTAVGNQRPGAFGAQSFAAGAGGALTGANEQMERNQAQSLQQKKIDFDESLATKNYDISKLNAAIRQRQMEMQIPWWQARADVLKVKQAQDSSSKAWQMSEPGRYHTVDNDVAKYQNGLVQQYRDELKQATLNNDTDQLAKIRDIIKKGTDEFRQQKYKEQNLDPNKADTVKQRGFEGTEDQIKHLPPGTRFWDPKAGMTRTRKADADSTPVGADQAAAAQPTQAEQMTASPEE